MSSNAANSTVGTVSPEVVRVVLFRVQPSQDAIVGREIEKRCASIGIPRESFRVFRLFGAYDLVFIQRSPNFLGSDLVRVGSINGITGSTEYVCYSWARIDGDGSDIALDLGVLDKPLLGLSFLKINPSVTQEHGLTPEISCVEYLAREYPDIQALGTLGWAEMLLLIPDDSLSGLLTKLNRVFPSIIRTQTASFSTARMFAEKTMTVLGYSLELTGGKGGKRHIISIEKELGSGKRKGRLEVHFSASCTPGSMRSLQEYAAKQFKLTTASPRITFRLGARDLDFEVPLKDVKTLNDLLERLDKFRADNASSLIRTHTELQFPVDTAWPSRDPRKLKLVVLELSGTEAEQLVALGPEGASVATAIYHFNSLMQNRLLLDTVSDLFRAMVDLKQKALRMSAPTKPTERRKLAARVQYIQQAMAQRYQGAYAGVEESPWGSSFGIHPAGVGVQRVLKALEFLPGEILLRLGWNWNGFALIGRHPRPSMEHFQDILHIPPVDALDARRHWAMSHEVMHMLQYLEPGQWALSSFSSVTPSLPEYDRTGKLLLEVGADLLEQYLCSPLSADECLRLVWKYYSENQLFLGSKDQLTSYLIRSFSVFYADRVPDLTTQPSDKKLERLWDEFILLVESCDIDLATVRECDSRGQRHLWLALHEFVMEVQPYIHLMVERIKSRRRDIEALPDIEAIRDSLHKLDHGELLSPSELSHPDIAAWLLAQDSHKSGEFSSRKTIAWILSLLHAYHVKKRGTDLTRAVSDN